MIKKKLLRFQFQDFKSHGMLRNKYSNRMKKISVSKQSLVKSQRYFMNTNTNSECESL